MGYQYRGKRTIEISPQEDPQQPTEPAPRRRRGKGRNPRGGNGCGTHAGYATHKREGTAICFPCKLARNEYKRALYYAQKDAA